MKQSIQDNIQNEPWLKSYWRPGMAWLYMVICACDFVIFPLISIFIPIITHDKYTPWTSLTLQNGGLIHLAFGAILGVTAWTRGTEKRARYFNNDNEDNGVVKNGE